VRDIVPASWHLVLVQRSTASAGNIDLTSSLACLLDPLSLKEGLDCTPGRLPREGRSPFAACPTEQGGHRLRDTQLEPATLLLFDENSWHAEPYLRLESPPNGSRLSCGRLARRRKGGGRQSVPARAQHSASFRATTARQLQALVRPRPRNVSLMRSMRSGGIAGPRHYVSQEIRSLGNHPKVASTTAAP